MNRLSIRLINLTAIILLLVFYNMKINELSLNSQLSASTSQVESLTETNSAFMDEINKSISEASTLSTDTEAIDDESSPASASIYKDGTYSGSAKGFGGDIIVSVTIKSDTITAIDLISHDGEDDAYFSTASAMTDKIISANSADVDTVSGATFSSTGIKNAVKAALESAKN